MSVVWRANVAKGQWDNWWAEGVEERWELLVCLWEWIFFVLGDFRVGMPRVLKLSDQALTSQEKFFSMVASPNLGQQDVQIWRPLKKSQLVWGQVLFDRSMWGSDRIWIITYGYLGTDSVSAQVSTCNYRNTQPACTNYVQQLAGMRLRVWLSYPSREQAELKTRL